MDSDLEIINNLAGYLKFAVIRTRNNELVFMNAPALELFGYRSTEEIGGSHQMLFVDPSEYDSLLAKTHGLIINERVHFIRKDQTNFWGLLTSKSRPHDTDNQEYINNN